MNISEMKKAINEFDYDFGELPEFPAKYGIPTPDTPEYG